MLLALSLLGCAAPKGEAPLPDVSVDLKGEKSAFGDYMLCSSLRQHPPGASCVGAMRMLKEGDARYLDFQILSGAPEALRALWMQTPSQGHSMADSLELTKALGMKEPLSGEVILRVEIALEAEGGRFRTLTRVRLHDACTFHIASRLLSDGSFEHTGYCGERPLPVLRCAGPEWRFGCLEGAREGLGQGP